MKNIVVTYFFFFQTNRFRKISQGAPHRSSRTLDNTSSTSASLWIYVDVILLLTSTNIDDLLEASWRYFTPSGSPPSYHSFHIPGLLTKLISSNPKPTPAHKERWSRNCVVRFVETSSRIPFCFLATILSASPARHLC